MLKLDQKRNKSSLVEIRKEKERMKVSLGGNLELLWMVWKVLCMRMGLKVS